MSPDQKKALRAFMVAALDGFVPAASIVWGRRDVPVQGDPWVAIWDLAEIADGPSEEVPFDNAGTPELRVREMTEETIEVQCGQRDGDTPSLTGPKQILRRVSALLGSSQSTYALRSAAVAPRRWGEVVDISAIDRGSQWEQRASLTVVVSRSEIIVDDTTSTIESLEVTGTTDPVPGTVGGTIP